MTPEEFVRDFPDSYEVPLLAIQQLALQRGANLDYLMNASATGLTKEQLTEQEEVYSRSIDYEVESLKNALVMNKERLRITETV